MAVRNRHSAAPGAASWWLLLVLALVTTFGFYVWYQQNKASVSSPREIQVALADSSGPLPIIDTTRTPAVPGTSVVTPVPTDTGPFIAPAPAFQGSSSVPVANFLDYARSMRFDPGRGTELTLPVDEFGRTRVVRLEPLVNLRRLDSTAFAQGRVIARIASQAALPTLSLHNGENYLWIQGTLGSTIQAEVWSTSVLLPFKRLPLIYSSRPPVGAPDGKDAFWLGDSNARVLWIACGRGWCHS